MSCVPEWHGKAAEGASEACCGGRMEEGSPGIEEERGTQKKSKYATAATYQV